MSQKIEQRINALLAIASLVGVVWVGHVVVSGMRSQKEMACRVQGQRTYTAEECAKVLREAAPTPVNVDPRGLL